MGLQTITVKMQQREETSTKWEADNTILLAGEMGVESDTLKFKFGDGITTWSNLPYATDASGTAESLVAAHNVSPDAHEALFATKANSTDLAKVATSGNYNDLVNTPTIPSTQVNSDWNATIGVAQILNKPESTAEQIDSAVTNSHSHSNKTVLDNLSDNSGTLYYNGEAIIGGSGTGSNVTFSGDLSGTDSNQTVAKFQGIPVNLSSATNGQVIAYNGSLNQYEPANISVTGIVGSTQITQADSDTTIASQSEQVFNYPTSDKILASVYEVIPSSTVNDTTITFDSSSKYNQQDSTKTTVYSGNLTLENNANTNYVQFNGSSGYAHMPYNAIYAPTSSITVECFANLSNWSISSNQDLVSKLETGGYAIIVLPGSVSFQCYTGSAYASVAIPSTNISSGWHRVSGSFDGRYLKIYLDGNLMNTTDLGSTGHAIKYSSNNDLMFAANPGSGNSPDSTPEYFKGSLGDIRIWNIACDNNTIKNDCFKALNGNETGLVEYWKINEGNGTILINSVAGGNNATLNAAYTWISDVPVLKQFTLVSSYVSTTGASNYSLTSVTQINSLTMPTTTPANTASNVLTSFDNRKNWLYHDTEGWHIYSGDLTSAWSNSNTNTDLQAYFTNLSTAQLTSDLSLVGITPLSLDFCWQLETTDSTQTPSVSATTCNYTTAEHLEGASVGSFSADGTRYGLKIISDTSLSIKNKDSVDHTLRVYTTVAS
jgi:hypothetical protein